MSHSTGAMHGWVPDAGRVMAEEMEDRAQRIVYTPRDDGGFELSMEAPRQGLPRAPLLRAQPFAAMITGGGEAGRAFSAGISQFMRVYNAALIGYVLLSWFPATPRWVTKPLVTVCNPYLGLFRGLIPPIRGIPDVSPILAFLALDVLTNTAAALPAELKQAPASAKHHWRQGPASR